MSHGSTSSDAFDETDASDEAVTEIPSCALDDGGKREQRARYVLLASSVTCIERQPDAVLIFFDRDLNRQTLEQALSVERQCCPFFTFAFDEQDRRLHATVADAGHVPALDAVAHALEAARRTDSKS
jgi:hypothetical protein